MTNNKKYIEWINSTKITQTTLNELAKFTSEQIDKEFGKSKIKFGTAGYRALMGPGTNKLNEITYGRLAIAYGRYLQSIAKEKGKSEIKVIVAHDNRYRSGEFTLVVAKVLMAMGIDVYLSPLNEVLATPIVSYLIRKLGLDGGAIITASHNPKEYNGFKIYNDLGGQLLPFATDFIADSIPGDIEYLSYDLVPKEANFKFITKDTIENYFRDAKALLFNKYQPNPDEPIIFTAHHGTASMNMVPFLKSLGYNVIPVKEQCIVDDQFTNSPDTNPENVVSYGLALEYADKYKSNLILAVDPDSDRLGVAERLKDGWRFFSGNDTGIMLTHFKLNYGNGYEDKTPVVVSTYVSTSLIDKILEDKNGFVVRTDTGFKWVASIIDKLNENEVFVCGFEEAIGSLPTDLIRDKDGYQAAAWMLEIHSMLKKRKMTFEDFLEKEIFPKYGCCFNETVQTIINVEDVEAAGNKVKKALLKYPEEKIGRRTIEAINFNNDGGIVEWFLKGGSWIRFRTSGTEPKYKIYYNLYGNGHGEGPYNSETNKLNKEADSITNEIKKYIKEKTGF